MQLGQVASLHRYPVKSMAGESLEHSEVGPLGLLGDRAFAVRDPIAGELRSARKWPQLMLCAARYAVEPSATHQPAARIMLPNDSEFDTDDPSASQQLSSWLGRSAELGAIRPASDRKHYRRANPGASLAATLSRSSSPLRKLIGGIVKVGPFGADLRQELSRESHEPLPDLSIYPSDILEYVTIPGTYFDTYPIHLMTTASLDVMRRAHPSGDWDVRRFRANFLIETPPSLTGFAELAWSGRTLRIGEAEFECTEPTTRCGMVTHPQPGLPKDPMTLRTIVRDAGQNLGIYARVKKTGRVSRGDMVELLER